MMALPDRKEAPVMQMTFPSRLPQRSFECAVSLRAVPRQYPAADTPGGHDPLGLATGTRTVSPTGTAGPTGRGTGFPDVFDRTQG